MMDLVDQTKKDYNEQKHSDYLTAKKMLYVVIEKYWANFNVFHRETILIEDWHDRIIKEINSERPRFTYKEFIETLNSELEVFDKMPCYKEILDRIIALRSKSMPTYEALTVHRDKEQAKKYLDMIRNKKFKE